MSVTLSTKCWEGDYRQVLSPQGLAELFDPLDAAAPRQVVLNRVVDRSDADARARGLVDAGLLDRYAWAEDLWSEVAAHVGVPVTWFGAAWPYSAPELCELHLAKTELVLHLAGDVRVAPGELWAPVAASALARWDEVAVVAPLTPSRSELAEPGARRLAAGWTGSQLFSDQCFLARRDELLRREVVTAVHPIAGRYPRPGGALTFEARVGAWMRSTGRWRATDEARDYRHPVTGSEGDSYAASGTVPVLLPAPEGPGDEYPPARSADVLGVVVTRDQERTVGNAVRSLAWCREVVVLDGGSEDRTAARASEAGGVVRTGTARDVKSLPGPLVVLDADELVPAGLAHALVDAVHGGYGLEAPVRVAERGQWFRAAGRRLLDPPEPGGTVRRADVALLRFGSVGLADALARLDRESEARSLGVVLARRAGGRLALKAVLLSLRSGRGWRRGAHEALAEWLWAEKAWEAARGGPTQVQATYDDIARRVLQGGSE